MQKISHRRQVFTQQPLFGRPEPQNAEFAPHRGRHRRQRHIGRAGDMAANLHGPVAHARPASWSPRACSSCASYSPACQVVRHSNATGWPATGPAIQTPGTAARRAGDVGIAVLWALMSSPTQSSRAARRPGARGTCRRCAGPWQSPGAHFFQRLRQARLQVGSPPENTTPSSKPWRLRKKASTCGQSISAGVVASSSSGLWQ